ncbi:MAG: AAA family ATPase [Lachnospiraceae bacterium]|nr:AAA family ATPase [Lachnospiraceae bacterium]
MRKHLQQFKIQSYKGLKGLSLDDLNCINIITGDNNSGKTSLLEVLSTLNNPQDTESWLPGTRIMGTRWRTSSYLDGFTGLFPADSDFKEISYEFCNDKGISKSVLVKADFGQTQISTGELNALNRMSFSSVKNEENVIIDTDYLDMTFYVNGEKKNEDIIYGGQDRLGRRQKKESFLTTLYVSPTDYASKIYNISRVFAPGDYEIMLEMVRTFDEDILQISAVKDENLFANVNYKVYSKSYKEPLLLNAYGDGMKKAIYLLNAVIGARSGILLIDEFETGIHTSAMDKVFSVLLESALRYDVQVFMTSHSKEAIEKVLRCGERMQPYVNLYTLYKYDGKNYARKLSCTEAIHAQDNLGLELR